jgi:hypothetical protein
MGRRGAGSGPETAWFAAARDGRWRGSRLAHAGPPETPRPASAGEPSVAITVVHWNVRGPMAEIRVEPKRRSLAWLWILLLLIVAAAVAWYFMYYNRTT